MFWIFSRPGGFFFFFNFLCGFRDERTREKNETWTSENRTKKKTTHGTRAKSPIRFPRVRRIFIFETKIRYDDANFTSVLWRACVCMCICVCARARTFGDLHENRRTDGLWRTESVSAGARGVRRTAERDNRGTYARVCYLAFSVAFVRRASR